MCPVGVLLCFGDAFFSCHGFVLAKLLENYKFLHFCTCETIDGSHCNFAISKEESPPDSPGLDSPGEDSPVTMREACRCKFVWFGFTQKCWCTTAVVGHHLSCFLHASLMLRSQTTSVGFC